jgi:hypothetical protein
MIYNLAAVLDADDLDELTCPLSDALIILSMTHKPAYEVTLGALERWGVETFTLADLREHVEEAQVLRALLKILTDHEEATQ